MVLGGLGTLKENPKIQEDLLTPKQLSRLGHPEQELRVLGEYEGSLSPGSLKS